MPTIFVSQQPQQPGKYRSVSGTVTLAGGPYLVSAFSPSMLDSLFDNQIPEVTITVKRVDYGTVKSDAENMEAAYAGHPGAADFFAKIVGADKVYLGRADLQVQKNTTLYVVVLKRRINPGEEISEEEMRTGAAYYRIEVK